MAHLYDERGNQLQLTDERGNPVTLTDEHGRPMHLTGVATTVDPTNVDVVTDTTIGVVSAPTTGCAAILFDQYPEALLFEPPPPLQPHQHQQVLHSTSSSSNSVIILLSLSKYEKF
ncbi:unnamed protein product [Cuscuta campestris]|uniref:Uncharacterized protein n=1 Tax=Cuscuta campestris TaxID=132261 RepID=A0A484KKI6_9ASTE|nr:unnamed protein product [Cuscuta campestris]